MSSTTYVLSWELLNVSVFCTLKYFCFLYNGHSGSNRPQRVMTEIKILFQLQLRATFSPADALL